MNSVVLMGRLCRDPEVRYTDGGMCIARYSLAVDRRFKKDGQPTADFFNCVAFAKSGEFAEKYFKKGTKIAIQGRLQNDTYEREGQKVTRTEIVVENQEFAESKAASQEAAPKADSNGFMPIGDDMEDLPFA